MTAAALRDPKPAPPPVDGLALRRELTQLAQSGADAATVRKGLIARLKSERAAALDKARALLEGGGGGLACARLLSDAQDEIIRVLYDFTVKHVYYAQVPSAAERIAIVATGGYGRGALAPGSDIDLLFLLPYKQTAWGESVVEYMLYALWDLGLKVGHATRRIEECLKLARSDVTIRTALLEARRIWGDEALFLELKSAFAKEVAAQTGADFVAAKLQERDQRHARTGESRYLVEPNVKDGKGGLRDLQTLYWIAKYLYRVEETRDLVTRGLLSEDELTLFDRAEDFLWAVRCHLHFASRRAEERLSFDMQREVAGRMGYGDGPGNEPVERFMKAYFLVAKDVGGLTRIFSAVLEDAHKKQAPSLGRMLFGFGRKPVATGFEIEGGRLHISRPDLFQKDPVNLLRLFQIAAARQVHIHPDALKAASRAVPLIGDALRASPEANRLFRETLAAKADPEPALRWMNECGVFGAFIPDFGRIVGQMQFNMYHHYTVDEHLIRAVGNLAKIEAGALNAEHPLAGQLVHQITNRDGLYLAMLLHDIAKGTERDHSEEGEDIANALAPRLGFSAGETETIAWLVRHHLVMSDVAQKRDLSDPRTIASFVDLVQSPERLKLLLILTVADIRSVGPGVFNGWKGQLLRDLYFAAEERMLGGRAETSRPQRVAAARETLAGAIASWPEAARERALARHYAPYWLSLPASVHERHAQFMRDAEAKGEPLALQAAADPFRAVTEITVYTPDHPGLFSRLAGGFALAGASIVDARIFTTADGMALDMFWIQDQDGQAFDPSRLGRLKETLLKTLRGETTPRKTLGERRRKARDEAFTVAPQIMFDNEASDTCTVIEVNARDRQGLLHDLTRALYEDQLSIHAAVIATYGERAVDVFYVKDLYGHKISAPQRLKRVERGVLAALGVRG
jgi:[protein-PII] uridylyltransferase